MSVTSASWRSDFRVWVLELSAFGGWALVPGAGRGAAVVAGGQRSASVGVPVHDAEH